MPKPQTAADHRLRNEIIDAFLEQGLDVIAYRLLVEKVWGIARAYAQDIQAGDAMTPLSKSQTAEEGFANWWKTLPLAIKNSHARRPHDVWLAAWTARGEQDAKRLCSGCERNLPPRTQDGRVVNGTHIEPSGSYYPCDAATIRADGGGDGH